MYLDITSRDAILYETYITEKKKIILGNNFGNPDSLQNYR